MRLLVQAALIASLLNVARSAAAALLYRRDNSDANEVHCPDDPGSDQNSGCFCPVNGTMMCPEAAADVGDFTDDSLTCSITKRDAGSNLIPTAGITTRQSDEKMVGVNYPYDLIYDPPDQNQEKVLKCVNPMKSAIYTLTEGIVRDTADRIVVNKWIREEAGSVITGVSGVLQSAEHFSIGRDTDRNFDAGSRWTIRFDADGGALPAPNGRGSWMKGTHVNLVVDGKDVGVPSTLKAAFSATEFKWLPVNLPECSDLTMMAKQYYQQVAVTLSKQLGYHIIRKSLATRKNPENDKQYQYFLSAQGRGKYDRNGGTPVDWAIALMQYNGKTPEEFAQDVATQLVNWYFNSKR